MGTNECSQPTAKSSWDSQDFGDVNMVLKWPIFTSPPGHNELILYNLTKKYSFFLFRDAKLQLQPRVSSGEAANLLTILSAPALTHTGARSSAATVLTTKFNMASLAVDDFE